MSEKHMESTLANGGNAPERITFRALAPYFTLGAAFGSVMGVLGYNYIASTHPDGPTEIDTTTVATAATGSKQQQLQLPSKIQPLIITSSSASLETPTTPEYVADTSNRIANTLKVATEAIAQTMDAAQSTVYTAETLPMEGPPIDSETGKPCYQLKDIQQAIGAINLPSGVTPYVILPPGICEKQPYAAYASGDNVVTTSKVIDNPGTAAHELGHVAGLHHTNSFDIKSGYGQGKLPQDIDMTEAIGQGYGDFRRVKNQDIPEQDVPKPNIEEASGETSIMGYHFPIDKDCTEKNTCDIFNLPEKYRLDPKKFPLYDIDPSTLNDSPTAITLSTEPYNVQGVRIPIPASHPIRQIHGGELLTDFIVSIKYDGNGSSCFKVPTFVIDKRGIVTELNSPHTGVIPGYCLSDSFDGWSIFNDSSTGVRIKVQRQNGETQLLVKKF